jgi:hypothetical protein
VSVIDRWSLFSEGLRDMVFQFPVVLGNCQSPFRGIFKGGNAHSVVVLRLVSSNLDDR